MKNRKPCVLIVNTTEFGPGGITKVIEEYYRCISADQCDFDVVAINDPVPPMHLQLFQSRGSRVVCLPRRENPIQYFFGVLKLCLGKKYDAIHVHGNSATMAIELLAAFLGGVRKRIAHCHTTACEHQKAHKLLIPLFSRLYTHALACSEQAGNWIFGEGQFDVLKNAVDTNLYPYSEDLRRQYRDYLGVTDDTLLLGHIGYFNETKNQSFLVDILSAMPDNTKMLFVGIGEKMEEVRQKVESCGLSHRVLFLGVRSDVPQLLQALDVFVFPSLWEGLGIALLEAQMSGLCCIASSQVPLEANISGNVAYLPLDTPEPWVHQILHGLPAHDRTLWSQAAIKAAKDKGYDIHGQAQKLSDIYQQ